jgi:phosphoglycolate phosphatase-like HAD superfamily hydrolase
MILEIMEELGFSPKDTIMVGDTRVDRKAARAARVRFVCARKFFKS